MEPQLCQVDFRALVDCFIPMHYGCSSRNVKVVAFGKAVLGMVAAVEELLGEHVVEGVASVPVGAVERARRQLPHWNTPSLGSKTR